MLISPASARPVLNRRGFLAACAGCVLAAACGRARATQAKAGAKAPASPGMLPTDKVRLRLVFTHIPPEKPTWPYRGYDYEARKATLAGKLRAACPYAEFLPATALHTGDAKKILESDSEVDGYVVYILGIWSGAPAVIAASNRPMILVDDLYAGSGEFLIVNAEAKRKRLRVAGVSSSRFEDVTQAIKAFDCLRKMRASTILDVVDREPGDNAAAIQQNFGTSVRRVSAEEINDAYRSADAASARAAAREWVRHAQRVVEPSRDDIANAGSMYIAMHDLMERHKAQAITVDCLTLLYGGKLPAYPCLGLFQLNNDGLVGACEADLQSTVSMLAMSYLVGRPGYISDPVIDTSKNQIIYAHCVSTNRVFGPDGPANPYHIRSHSEDRKGAVVRSLMPLGQMTTTLKFNPVRREVVMHQGRSVANVDDDKGCRTKLAVEVRDIQKLLGEWDRWGWHRVTFYGDWKQQVETLAALAGFTVIQEG